MSTKTIVFTPGAFVSKHWLIWLLISGLGLAAWTAGVAQAGGVALPAADPASPGPTLALAGNPPLEPPGATSSTEQPDQWRNYTNGNEVKALAVTDDSLWIATTGVCCTGAGPKVLRSNIPLRRD